MLDDSPDFTRAQQEHGAKIRLERNVMDTYGVTRTQARRVLKGVEDFQKRIEVARAQAVVVTTPPAIPQVSESTLSSPKLQPVLAQKASVAGGSGASPVGGAMVTVILCKNFVPTYYEFVGVEGDPV